MYAHVQAVKALKILPSSPNEVLHVRATRRFTLHVLKCGTRQRQVDICYRGMLRSSRHSIEDASVVLKMLGGWQAVPTTSKTILIHGFLPLLQSENRHATRNQKSGYCSSTNFAIVRQQYVSFGCASSTAI